MRSQMCLETEDVISIPYVNHLTPYLKCSSVPIFQINLLPTCFWSWRVFFWILFSLWKVVVMFFIRPTSVYRDIQERLMVDIGSLRYLDYLVNTYCLSYITIDSWKCFLSNWNDSERSHCFADVTCCTLVLSWLQYFYRELTVVWDFGRRYF